MCEYNLDHPADDRCPKHRAYLDLVESADELAGKIMNGGREYDQSACVDKGT